jgi:hypothetical protein
LNKKDLEFKAKAKSSFGGNTLYHKISIVIKHYNEPNQRPTQHRPKVVAELNESLPQNSADIKARSVQVGTLM